MFGTLRCTTDGGDAQFLRHERRPGGNGIPPKCPRIACDHCRLKKTRCDGRRTGCARCKAVGVVCTYSGAGSATRASRCTRPNMMSPMSPAVFESQESGSKKREPTTNEPDTHNVDNECDYVKAQQVQSRPEPEQAGMLDTQGFPDLPPIGIDGLLTPCLTEGIGVDFDQSDPSFFWLNEDQLDTSLQATPPNITHECESGTMLDLDMNTTSRATLNTEHPQRDERAEWRAKSSSLSSSAPSPSTTKTGTTSTTTTTCDMALLLLPLNMNTILSPRPPDLAYPTTISCSCLHLAVSLLDEVDSLPRDTALDATLSLHRRALERCQHIQACCATRSRPETMTMLSLVLEKLVGLCEVMVRSYQGEQTRRVGNSGNSMNAKRSTLVMGEYDMTVGSGEWTVLVQTLVAMQIRALDKLLHQIKASPGLSQREYQLSRVLQSEERLAQIVRKLCENQHVQ
ncbi:hypothetical protein BJY01DRAFT_253387 [Aspergillus pseudoustus]|uniref:Zn(2)-C6 fungal-type domain-containing protein n=1 Tax=Aspergillus pseudoustus TaxID=1810923 RepID=A0ABR4J0W4_9EURO